MSRKRIKVKEVLEEEKTGWQKRDGAYVLGVEQDNIEELEPVPFSVQDVFAWNELNQEYLEFLIIKINEMLRTFIATGYQRYDNPVSYKQEINLVTGCYLVEIRILLDCFLDEGKLNSSVLDSLVRNYACQGNWKSVSVIPSEKPDTWGEIVFVCEIEASDE